jgi:hypothetical protein
MTRAEKEGYARVLLSLWDGTFPPHGWEALLKELDNFSDTILARVEELEKGGRRHHGIGTETASAGQKEY